MTHVHVSMLSPKTSSVLHALDAYHYYIMEQVSNKKREINFKNNKIKAGDAHDDKGRAMHFGDYTEQNARHNVLFLKISILLPQSIFWFEPPTPLEIPV